MSVLSEDAMTEQLDQALSKVNMSYDRISFAELVLLLGRTKKRGWIRLKDLSDVSGVSVPILRKLLKCPEYLPTPKILRKLADAFEIDRDHPDRDSFLNAATDQSARDLLFNNHNLEDCCDDHHPYTSPGKCIHILKQYIELTTEQIAEDTNGIEAKRKVNILNRLEGFERIAKYESDEDDTETVTYSKKRKYLSEGDASTIAKGLRLNNVEENYKNLRLAISKPEENETDLDRDLYRKKILYFVLIEGAYHAPSNPPSVASFPPDNHPNPIGRDELLSKIENALADTSVGLYGLEGIGKTWMARYVSKNTKDQMFPGGQAYITLKKCEDNERLIQQKILAPFYHKGHEDDDYQRGFDWVNKQFKYQNGRSITIDSLFKETFDKDSVDPKLLIIDDVEEVHLPYLERIVSRYFHRSRAIIISKSRGSQSYQSIKFIEVEPLKLEDATTLLAWKCGFNNSVLRQERLKKLAQRLTCHPLSLWIANCKLRTAKRPEDLQYDLYDILTFKKGTHKDERFGNDWHKAIFDSAYETLLERSATLTKAFRALSVFSQSTSIIPKEILTMLWSDTPEGLLNDDQYRNICKGLEITGLIQVPERNSGIRVHSLVLYYANIRIAENYPREDPTGKRINENRNPNEIAAEQVTVGLIHARFYSDSSAKVKEKVISSGTARDGLIEFADISPQVAKILQFLSKLAIDDKSSMELLNNFLESTTYLDFIHPANAKEREVLLDKVLALIEKEPGSKHKVLWILLQRGNAQAIQGKYSDARKNYERVLQDLPYKDGIPDARQFTTAHASALIGLSNTIGYMLFGHNVENDTEKVEPRVFDVNQFEQAEKYLEDAKYIAGNVKDREVRFFAECSYGDLYLCRFNYTTSEDENNLLNVSYLSEAAAHYRAAQILLTGKRRSVGSSNLSSDGDSKLLNLRLEAILKRKFGDLCWAKGQFEEARNNYIESRELAKSVHYDLAVYHVYRKEAEVLRKMASKAPDTLREMMLKEESRNCDEKAEAIKDLYLFIGVR